MDEQRQNNQQETLYNSSVLIQDIALKTYQKQWTIEKGGRRGLGISVLMVRHDDDDDDDLSGLGRFEIRYKKVDGLSIILVTLHK